MRELSFREQKAPGGGHTARAETCTWWALITTLFCLPLEVTVRGSCNDLGSPTGQSSSPPPATSRVTLQESHNLSEHPLEKEMATHSSVLAWRIPGTAEPVGLPSMGFTQNRTRLKRLSRSHLPASLFGRIYDRGKVPSTVPRAQWLARRCFGHHFYRGKSVPRPEPHPAPPLRRARADHS